MDELAYSDLYDRVTVERCREHKKLVEEQAEAIDPNDPMANKPHRHKNSARTMQKDTRPPLHS